MIRAASRIFSGFMALLDLAKPLYQRRSGAFIGMLANWEPSCFFDRDVNERNDPSIVIRTLAHQLASSSDPRIGDIIRIAVKINLDIVMSPLGHQFQKLILEPVSIIADHNPTVIILDALDECGSAHDRERLLGVFANELVNLPSNFHTLITSRADIDIYDAFKFQPLILAHELDILSYFRHCMSLVRRKKRP